MTKCPHCSALCNPLRFVIYTKWTPYKCGKCGQRSEFKLSHLSIFGGIGGGFVGGFGSYAVLNYGWESVIFLIPAIIVMFTLMMWLFMSLETIKAEQGVDSNT